MAPRGTPKQTTTLPIRRIVTKTSAPTTINPVLKQKTMLVTKLTDSLPKDNNPKTNQRTRTITVAVTKEAKTAAEPRLRTRTEPKLATPKANEKKPVAPPGSVTKSGKKPAWKRRPKPAHSGVPVPEKMKKLLTKYLQEENDLQQS